MPSIRFMLGAVALGASALLATPAAHADTIPEDAVVLSCTEVFPEKLQKYLKLLLRLFDFLKVFLKLIQFDFHLYLVKSLQLQEF